MSKATLRIVHGFLGAGKSTYSRWLAAQTGEIRLNADEYCEEKFSKEELEENWDDCFSKAIQDLYVQTENYLRAGRSVILDFGFWSKESRDYARVSAGGHVPILTTLSPLRTFSAWLQREGHQYNGTEEARLQRVADYLKTTENPVRNFGIMVKSGWEISV